MEKVKEWNTAAEDEPDTDKVFFDTGKFRAFAKGFIQETKDLLIEVELESGAVIF